MYINKLHHTFGHYYGLISAFVIGCTRITSAIPSQNQQVTWIVSTAKKYSLSEHDVRLYVDLGSASRISHMACLASWVLLKNSSAWSTSLPGDSVPVEMDDSHSEIVR